MPRRLWESKKEKEKKLLEERNDAAERTNDAEERRNDATRKRKYGIIAREFLANVRSGYFNQACTILQNAPSHVGIADAGFWLVNGMVWDQQSNDMVMTETMRPLHFAAKRGDFRMVEILLTNGARPDAVDVNKMTPLHVATTAQVAHLLMDYDGSVRDVDLRLCCRGGNADVVMAVVQRYIGDIQGAFHEACNDGRLEVVKVLWEDERIGSSTKRNYYAHDGYERAFRGECHVDVMLFLLSKAPSLKTGKDDFFPQKLYDQVCLQGNTKGLTLLLNSPYLCPNYRVPLNNAKRQGHDEICQMLLKVYGPSMTRRIVDYGVGWFYSENSTEPRSSSGDDTVPSHINCLPSGNSDDNNTAADTNVSEMTASTKYTLIETPKNSSYEETYQDILRELESLRQLVASGINNVQEQLLQSTDVINSGRLRCPRLVILVPEQTSSRMKRRVYDKYRVYFLCAYNYCPVQTDIVIQQPKEWVRKVVPIVQLTLFSLSVLARVYELPLPMMGSIFDGESASLDIIAAHVEAFLHFDELKQVDDWIEDVQSSPQALQHILSEAEQQIPATAYAALVAEAYKPSNIGWQDDMQLVYNGATKYAWVHKDNVQYWKNECSLREL